MDHQDLNRGEYRREGEEKEGEWITNEKQKVSYVSSIRQDGYAVPKHTSYDFSENQHYAEGGRRTGEPT